MNSTLMLDYCYEKNIFLTEKEVDLIIYLNKSKKPKS